MSTLVVDIAVGVSVNKTFHYRCPEEMQGLLTVGSRVLVPFGSRRVPGTVVGFPDQVSAEGLKQVLEVNGNALRPALLELARWMSEYYLYPLGQTIETLVPGAVSRTKPKKKKYIRLKSPLVPDLSPGGRGIVKGKKRIDLLNLLAGQGEMSIEQLAAFSRATIRSLVESGIAEVVEREAEAVTEAFDFTPSRRPDLMAGQREAVRAITDETAGGRFGVFLLHGVTGSGKTEVYLHAIEQLAGTGKGAIVLAPEIALTPQLLARFRKRFGNRVAVLHSGLSDRERADEYRRIQAGEVDVAVGARSAVFAPFAKTGLIVVDEEHENSYKQDEGLRYHARDAAIMRAKFESAVAVLGSATPSLESYYNARSGKYRYLRLEHRVDHRPLPEVAIIDARTLAKDDLHSPRLLADIGQRLEKKEQVLLLLNRRGFSSVLVCRECGAAVRCPSCSVSLTFHKADRSLKCHYCGHFTHPPERCPSCSGADLTMIGSGTQKIEEELQKLFPTARVRRMDSDAVRGRDAYERLLQQVDRREVDILLGTQMVAKGHDFPGVTLVGVVDADIGLNLPDFRSAEKTFQLITQAAGRAGRGDAGGEVIIQTMNPGHYSILHSRTHDYEGFYHQEMAYRQQLRYPPVGRFVKLEMKSADADIAKEASLAARNRVSSLLRDTEVTVLGPAPAPVSKVRGRYRFQLLLLSHKRDRLRFLASEARNAVEERFGRKCRVIIDVDPVHLM